MTTDPLSTAAELVAARFPRAAWAMLTGSVLGPHRTAVSDLDIVVMLPDGPAALSFGGRWVSGGKWLLRELREYDPELAERWLAARDDPAPPARQVLASAGGPLFDGYRAGDG